MENVEENGGKREKIGGKLRKFEEKLEKKPEKVKEENAKCKGEKGLKKAEDFFFFFFAFHFWETTYTFFGSTKMKICNGKKLNTGKKLKLCCEKLGKVTLPPPYYFSYYKSGSKRQYFSKVFEYAVKANTLGNGNILQIDCIFFSCYLK